MTDREAMKLALDALEGIHVGNMTPMAEENWNKAIAVLRQALEQPDNIEEAIAAGDSVLLNEQAALLRECRAALDSLIKQKPTLTALVCGSTTLGNLRVDLHAYRPQGVFGGVKND